MTTIRTFNTGDIGKREGFRSGLEEALSLWLVEKGVSVEYETDASRIKYTKPAKSSTYTPDFTLPNGIIIETKGRFVTADRQKHILIKGQHPDKDIRFVFQNPNGRISKASRTTYAMWCEKHGFLYCKAPTPPQLRKGAAFLPKEWLDEKSA
jgi:hypothetical protein